MPDRPISSEEVDALMDAVQTGEMGATGEGDKPRVKIYDFACPEKFSKEQLRTLEMIYESCARGLTTQLSAALRTHTEVDPPEIKETSYQELFDGIEGAASIALMSIAPLVGRGLLVIDAGICFALIDRMLGGPGETAGETRELTEVEKGLMGRIIERVAKCITDAWGTLVVLKPELDVIVGSALFSQIAVPSDRMVVASFNVRFGSVAGVMHFGIPATSLDPVLAKLSAQQWFSGGRQTNNEAFVETIKQSLDNTDLDIAVQLGGAVLTIRDLMDLQVGDLLCLNRKAGADLIVLVEGECKFLGQPGQVGRSRGVKITCVMNGRKYDDGKS
jgi:flagellar motor switch protein FliM